MLETARLAGFFAAHGIWSVSDGAILTPLLGYELPNGERGLHRFANEDVGVAAQAGQEALATNPTGAVRAVLVVDGYLRLPQGRTDALIVDAVRYGPAQASFTMGVPYRPQQHPLGFAVHRPKFLKVAGVDEQGAAALADSFFEGVGSHEKAAPVWQAHLDPSI